MPPVPIVDSHVHLWDPVKVEIPWLTNVPKINVKRDLADYAEATSGRRLGAAGMAVAIRGHATGAERLFPVIR